MNVFNKPLNVTQNDILHFFQTKKIICSTIQYDKNNNTLDIDPNGKTYMVKFISNVKVNNKIFPAKILISCDYFGIVDLIGHSIIDLSEDWQRYTASILTKE